MKLRSKHANPTDPHSLALMSGSEQPSSANMSNMSFALSSLLSVSEEQLEVLKVEELALITRRFMRFNVNRKRTCEETITPTSNAASRVTSSLTAPTRTSPRAGTTTRTRTRTRTRRKRRSTSTARRRRSARKARHVPSSPLSVTSTPTPMTMMIQAQVRRTMTARRRRRTQEFQRPLLLHQREAWRLLCYGSRCH